MIKPQQMFGVIFNIWHYNAHMKQIAHHFIKTSILFLTALSVSVFSVKAEVSQWQDLGGGRARLVSVFNPGSGLIEGILEVELQPGWTTYWRNPGESGIPPTFDFSKSTGVRVDEPSFPAPHSKKISGIVSIGYVDKVAFPFVATPLISPMSGKLKLEVLIGVCEVICIPAIANFSIDIERLNISDPLSQSLISAAKMKVPVRFSADSVENADLPQIVDAKKISDSIVQVQTKIPLSAKKPELFAEGKPSWFFNPAKLIKREGIDAMFELSLADLPESADLSKIALRLTLTNGNSGSERSFMVGK